MSGRLPIERDQLVADLPALEGPMGDTAVRTWQRVVARRYRARDSAVRRLLALADVLGIAVAMTVSLLVLSYHPTVLLWSLAVLPVWIVVFKAYGLYDRDLKRISHQTLDDLPWIFHAVLVGCLLTLACYRFLPVDGVWLGPLAACGVLAIALVATLRAAARRLAISVLGPEPVVLLGKGTEMSELARKLEAGGRLGAKSVGQVSLADVDLGRVVADHGAERVVVAREDLDGDASFTFLNRARELGVKVSVLPQLFDALGPSVEIDDVDGMIVLGVTPPVLPRSSRFLKRVMDVVGAALLLILAAPLLVAVAIAIKLDSRGPVLFQQERIGLWGQRFKLFKFRTMTLDADERRGALLVNSKDPGWLLLDHDPRVTRVGGFLRQSSIDELPQLWNVLKGEMSLVGPRPIVPSEDSQLAGWRRSRIDLTPGLTGLWQVMGRTTIPFEEMIRLDYLYVTNWSLWTDVRLMLRTLPAVLGRRGVN